MGKTNGQPRFSEEFKKIASRGVEGNNAALVLQHVIIPISIGVLGVSTAFLWETSRLLAIGAWGFLAAIYVLNWWKSNIPYSDVYRLLLQKKEDEEEIARLSEVIEDITQVTNDLSVKNISSFVLRGMAVDYIKQIREKGLSGDFLEEMLSDILTPLYMEADFIFGFGISEKWSIGVYIFDHADNVLRPVWRRKSQTHPSTGLGRNWLPGEGHVGKAFLDRRPILTGNANDETVAQLCKARASKQASYDDTAYISFASVPIFIPDDDDNKNPFGVLVVTSGVEDRLSEESTTELLMHFAHTLAVIFELIEQDIGCFVNPNHDIEMASQGG